MRAGPDERTTRRGFHRRLAQLATAGATAGVLSARTANKIQAAERATAQFPPGRYVDMHTHLGQTWNQGQPLSAAELLRWMDANDIAQAVVLPLISPESSSYPLTSDFVLAETAAHRDRLIPFCSIDPRTSYRGGQAGAVAMLEKYAAAGAKGFGEHKPGVKINDPRNVTLFTACGEVGLPVLFHLDNLRNTDTPGLPGLAEVLAACPKTIFIGHGPGWWASISGGLSQADLAGYPKGPVAPGGAIDALMDQFDNIYGEMSAGSGANAISRDPEFGPKFLERRADRLMFGTDFLAPGQNVPQLELFREIEIPASVQAKVFRDNARRVLGLG